MSKGVRALLILRKLSAQHCPLFVFSMKSFFWNVRGINGKQRQPLVKDWIRHNRPLLGGFLETHVQQENLFGVMNLVVPGWRFEGTTLLKLIMDA